MARPAGVPGPARSQVMVGQSRSVGRPLSQARRNCRSGKWSRLPLSLAGEGAEFIAADTETNGRPSVVAGECINQAGLISRRVRTPLDAHDALARDLHYRRINVEGHFQRIRSRETAAREASRIFAFGFLGERRDAALFVLRRTHFFEG